MNAKRGKFIATFAALALALTACSAGGGGTDTDSTGEGAGGKKMRLALNQTEEHPSYIALKAFGERLDKATSGKWNIEVFPNETLGAQQEALQMVSNGSVDMAIVSGTQLENLNKDFLVLNMPGAFDNIEKQMKILKDQELLGDLYASLETEQKITVLGGFTQGERSVYTVKAPAKTPADLAGVKLRVQESDLHLAMAAALGAQGTPMAYGEVYSGLQSGVIGAAENNEVSYYTVKHFEVAKYYNLTKHLVGTDYLIINTDTLKTMSAEDRATFDKEWLATVDEHTNLWGTKTKEAIDKVTAGGAEMVEVDAAAFKEALAPLADKFLTEASQKKLWETLRDAQK
ncbi:MAG: TRAP transporter substrate-binding protein [Actinomycetaceae bacterium]|nr:TRAP transporter substrate-binding protein [Actinomycetaceae bacterium]